MNTFGNMEKIQNKFTVVGNEKLCPRFYRLCLDAKVLTKTIKPGQFIHIRVQESLEPFFRRPFSIYRAQKHIEIFYEAIGPGTCILSEKKKGDELDILGPLGNSFALPPKGTKTVVMIAGGIGVAPFLFFSDVLKNKGYELVLLYGGRSRGHVFNMKEFKKNGCKVFIATDDGSVGVKGRVSRLFSQIPLDVKRTFLYTCGPNPMMAAVQDFARQNHLQGQASCEEVMACALGACLGCSIETQSGYKTVCYDGPVFDLAQVKFHS
jgi:dihydroorotate dehydrogenase electron transfer subunit